MKYTASKRFRMLCGILAMLALLASIASVPALAASNGIYIATATPHYKHPTTGRIEDAGGEGSAVLGQSMTESATYKKALVEVDSAGNIYITVRLQLMDNIQDPQFQVDGKTVSASLMQEDYTENTADYRMKVNSEHSILRCNMYVTAMGREVIFYITVSNLQSGCEDFITSVKVEQPKAPNPIETQPAVPSQSQSPTETQPPAQTEPPVTEAPVPTQAPVQTGSVDTTPPSADTAEVSDTKADPSDTTKVKIPEKPEETALGLLEFDKDGNKVDQDSDHTKDTTSKKSGSSTVIWWILSGIVIIAAAGGCVWYFCFFQKKKKGVDKDET